MAHSRLLSGVLGTRCFSFVLIGRTFARKRNTCIWLARASLGLELRVISIYASAWERSGVFVSLLPWVRPNRKAMMAYDSSCQADDEALHMMTCLKWEAVCWLCYARGNRKCYSMFFQPSPNSISMVMGRYWEVECRSAGGTFLFPSPICQSARPSPPPFTFMNQRLYKRELSFWPIPLYQAFLLAHAGRNLSLRPRGVLACMLISEPCSEKNLDDK